MKNAQYWEIVTFYRKTVILNDIFEKQKESYNVKKMVLNENDDFSKHHKIGVSSRFAHLLFLEQRSSKKQL